MITPQTTSELADAVRSAPRVLAVGAGTKPRLAQGDAALISTRALRGITEYDPSEFTFTALAGTPLREIAAALAERGQYLPFDPPLLDAGATLAGTVAAGLAGPGRFRFGGVRDFILGVRFVDGTGRLLRLGGKVVKNAAGFDVPKFFVGSLGRFGVLAEITFKVFPRPAATRTLRLDAATPEAAVQILTAAASARFEFDALDLAPGETGVLARLATPAAALDALTGEVLAHWPGAVLPGDEALRIWTGLREFSWCDPAASFVKVALAPANVAPLGLAITTLAGARLHVSAGGNVAYVALAAAADAPAFDQHLTRLGLAGLTLRGAAPLWLGRRAPSAIADAVKHALDPDHRFPSLHD